MQYIFILGNTPQLSVAEITSLLRRRQISYKTLNLSEEVLFLETTQPLEAENFLQQLGGTIKIAQVVYQLSADKLKPEIIAELFLPQKDTKWHFGFSLYSLAGSLKLPKNFGLEVKKKYKTQKISARLVTSSEKTLSSVVVAKNRLLKNGAEICLIADRGEIFIAKTLAVQSFGQYNKFDIGRPQRDVVSGLLPPKIAKIMINLAGQNKTAVLLDPFCGSGTILSQAALLGYKNIIGSDVSAKAIADSRDNFTFIKQHSPHIAQPQFYQLDATKLSEKIKSASVDAIITEPYLGPPLRYQPRVDQAKKIVDELSDLYRRALQQFTKVLKSGGIVVMIFPIIGEQRTSKILAGQKDFRIVDQPIVYRRLGQKVAREIVTLIKK